MLDKEDLLAIQTLITTNNDVLRETIRNDTKTLITENNDVLRAETKALIAENNDVIRAETKAFIAEVAQRIAKNTVALMDAEFKPRFDLLAEGIQDIQDRMVPRSQVEDLEDEVKFLKLIVRQLAQDVNDLKKAN